MTHIAVLSLHTSPLDQPGVGDGGGLNVYVRELASALARSGVVCDVYARACAPNTPPVIEVEPGFRIFNIESGPLRPLTHAEFLDHMDEMADKITALLIDRDNDYEDPVMAIHANYWLSALVGHEVKHQLEIPLVTTFHTLEKVKVLQGQGNSDLAASIRRIEKEAMIAACSDVVTASCDAEVADLMELYGVDMARLAIISPGIEKSFFQPGNRDFAKSALGEYVDFNYGIELSSSFPNPPLVLFVGRMQPLKSVDIAIGAFTMLEELGIKNAKLLLLGGPSGSGSADWYESLKLFVQDAGMGQDIIFLPPQPHEVLSTFYRAADCVIVPSRSESFGLVALEAMACATPVIAADVGGLSTLIENDKEGFLVSGHSVVDYADVLVKVLRDSELQARLGRAGLLKASVYTWRSAATRLNYLYKGISVNSIIKAC
ncbi:MAG: glycosyltransferase [Firmicutes bacterium]|nr:glycosyltransferase [Bacillota bacterium]